MRAHAHMAVARSSACTRSRGSRSLWASTSSPAKWAGGLCYEHKRTGRGDSPFTPGEQGPSPPSSAALPTASGRRQARQSTLSCHSPASSAFPSVTGGLDAALPLPPGSPPRESSRPAYGCICVLPLPLSAPPVPARPELRCFSDCLPQSSPCPITWLQQCPQTFRPEQGAGGMGLSPSWPGPSRERPPARLRGPWCPRPDPSGHATQGGSGSHAVSLSNAPQPLPPLSTTLSPFIGRLTSVG